MKRPVLLAAAAALSVLAPAALGYVLPQGAILRRMAELRNEAPIASVKVEGSLTFYGPQAAAAGAALGTAAQGSEVVSDGTLSLKLPGRCRADARVVGGNALSVVQTGAKRKAEGAEIPALNVAVEQICAVLAVRASSAQETRNQVERHLRALGVEPRVTSLARLGTHVAYVLGDAADGKPQFWVYKDGFRPARVRYTDADKVEWDVRFVDYASSVAGDGLPRNVEVWRAGTRVLRFAAIKGDTRTTLPDSLFPR